MPRSVVNQQEIFGGASSAVHSIVHEVQIFRTVACQIARPNSTNEGIIRYQSREPRSTFVRKSQPVSQAILTQIHIQHRLLAEGVSNDHIIPRVAVHVHDIDVTCKTGVGDKFWCELHRHVDEHSLLIDEKQIRFWGFRGCRKWLFPNHNHVRPPVFVQVRWPQILFFIVADRHAEQFHPAFGLDVPV